MPIQKLSAQNNGWTKKEAKIFRRNSVISRILHWLDWNRQLWSKDIQYIYTTQYDLSTSWLRQIQTTRLNEIFWKWQNKPVSIESIINIHWDATLEFVCPKNPVKNKVPIQICRRCRNWSNMVEKSLETIMRSLGAPE